jgi:hypothetical protein
MKRRIAGSLVLSLSLLVSLLSFPLRAHGQQLRRFRSTTGVVTIGMGQVLRVIVNGQGGNDTIHVQFAWMKYMPAGCNSDGVCRHTVQSQGATAPVTVGSNEAASFDIQGNGNGVEVLIRVDATNITANALIINTVTGDVVSHVIMANTEGDFH